jgi:hypothetical protein
MREYREEVVRTPAPDAVIEEEVVEDAPTAERVVRTTVDSVPDQTVVVERVPAPRRTIRTFLRREPVARDVVSTEYYTAPAYSYDPVLAQFLRVSWFLLGLLQALLALRFLLAVMGANPSNPFAATIYALTGAFVAPFRTLFSTPAAGGSVVELYTLIAMLVYFLAWWAVVKLIGVVTNRPVDV